MLAMVPLLRIIVRVNEYAEMTATVVAVTTTTAGDVKVESAAAPATTM